MRYLAVLFASLACASCLIGTTPPPVDPGVDSLPAGSVAIREQVIINQLGVIRKAEDLHLATRGGYATLEQLVADGGLNASPQGLGYTIDLNLTGGGYEVIAVPNVYGPNGRRSFYMDEGGTVRGADHQGGAPSASDPPA
jgi:hypothetical protein